MSWRDSARPIIKEVLEKHHDNEGALKRALFDAYPFGERKYHPYKIWLDEIKVQRGFKTFNKRKPVSEPPIENADQTKMF